MDLLVPVKEVSDCDILSFLSDSPNGTIQSLHIDILFLFRFESYLHSEISPLWLIVQYIIIIYL